MSLYKPAKSRFWHYDFTQGGNRYHGSTKCTAKRDAQRVEDDRRRQIALGTKAKPTITLEEACNTWQATVGDHFKSRRTTLYQLAYLIVGLGGSQWLHDLEPMDLQDYASRRRAQVSVTSVNREFQLLRRVIKWARTRKHEVPEIDWPELMFKEPNERVRELSPDEQERLFAVLPEKLQPLVEFALLCGQRKAEIVNLRWADVDLHGRRAKLSVKGGGVHTIPLSWRMVEIIEAQLKACPQVFTYVCERPAPQRKDRPARVKGQRYPLSVQGWNRQWRNALKLAGIEDYRFHDNRHTAATRNLRSSGNLKAVQKLLGHRDISTTARYAHALEDDVRAMLDATDPRTIPEPIGKQRKKA